MNTKKVWIKIFGIQVGTKVRLKDNVIHISIRPIEVGKTGIVAQISKYTLSIETRYTKDNGFAWSIPTDRWEKYLELL